MIPIKPWYRSRTMIGLVAAGAFQLISQTGADITLEETTLHVDHLFGFLNFAALVYAGWSRTRNANVPVSKQGAAKLGASLNPAAQPSPE